jgi:Rrf2 family nitric oxide-sensitive transcriptional repressor
MYLELHRERMCSVKEIAGHYGISRNHLVKVVHRLGQLGFVETSKGKGGGIRLTLDARTLRLGDLVKALEPSMNVVECFDHNTNTCKITGACQLKHYFYEARQAFLDTMNKHTLADTVENKHLFSPAERVQ